ncbi:hypothetical protein [Peptoniphilus sp. BV3AC2]|uniref:hypothetical protein n=1 Tax=Peptoniphilus sp. BV3AC2 TaxID=1111133 RepID=UPI0003B8D0B9|nr:hypothetical protein [Peptoniphilus sp. BV3AC2]ERT64686.1 hypothetical protein HMPREF1252_1532 [Peptoniphilus sp. BV3AC2]
MTKDRCFFYNEEFTKLHAYMFLFVGLSVGIFLFDSLKTLKKEKLKKKKNTSLVIDLYRNCPLFRD